MNNAKKNNGFELIEYGAFVIAEKYVDMGESIYLTYDHGTVKAETAKPHKKLAIWQNGELVSPYLSNKNGYTQFAATIINYSPDIMNMEALVRGYEVWKDTDGNVKIVYTESTKNMSLCSPGQFPFARSSTRRASS